MVHSIFHKHTTTKLKNKVIFSFYDFLEKNPELESQYTHVPDYFIKASYEKDDYSIVESWKKQPTLFFTLVSIMSASSTFIINAVLTFFDNLYLRYWGIYTNIGNSNANQFGTSIIILLSFVLITFSLAVQYSSTLEYLSRIWFARVKLYKARKMSSKQWETKKRDLYKGINKVHFQLLIKFALSIAFVFVFTFATYILDIQTLAYNSKMLFEFSFDMFRDYFFLIPLVILMEILCILLLKTCPNKLIAFPKNDTVSPFMSIPSLRPMEYLTNSMVKAICLYIVLLILLVLPITLWSRFQLQQFQKTFPIYTDEINGTTYALIHNTNDTYYYIHVKMEEDDSLIIYMDEHRIVKSDDTTLENKTFRTITKVFSDHSQFSTASPNE